MILYFSLIELAELLDAERSWILSRSEVEVWHVSLHVATVISLTPLCTGTPAPGTCGASEPRISERLPFSKTYVTAPRCCRGSELDAFLVGNAAIRNADKYVLCRLTLSQTATLARWD